MLYQERGSMGQGGELLLPRASGLRVDISPTVGAPEMGTIAERVFEEGQRVFVVSGPILRAPTIYSFQLDRDHHIDPRETDEGFGIGHYVNHSCEPTTGWGGIVMDEDRVGIQFVAVRRILPGQEVTFDYATTEWDTTAKDRCRCGGGECRGNLHGYRDLPAQFRERYGLRGMIPPYLLRQEVIQNPQ